MTALEYSAKSTITALRVLAIKSYRYLALYGITIIHLNDWTEKIR